MKDNYLSKQEEEKLDAYFRATNFLAAAELYLKDNREFISFES